jgi:hypothetical protein
MLNCRLKPGGSFFVNKVKSHKSHAADSIYRRSKNDGTENSA